MKYLEELQEQKDIIERMGYKVAYICLYGSQNYDLDIYTDEYRSDIDMKAIIVPTLDNLVYNSKPISKTIDTEWGQCDLKDIRPYSETLLKSNPAYIETLFTDYYLIDVNFVDEFQQIFAMRDKLVETLRCQFVRAMYGMMCEKQKALCHPYPSIADKIEKFGCDGKQAHHVYRLWLMMQDYFENKMPLSECLYPPKDSLNLLRNLKLNKISLENTKRLVDDIMFDAKEFKNNVLSNIDEDKIDYTIKSEFINLSHSIIKNKITKDIKDGVIWLS